MSVPRVVEKLSMIATLLLAGVAHAQEPSLSGTPKADPPDVKKLVLPEGEAQDLKLLEPTCHVWMDKERKRLVMDGRIVLREGQLEMFACIAGTKEHESIVAVETKAYVVHAGLLACGAEAGKPVQFQPEFRPASGTEIDITVYWNDKDGKLRSARAQEWVRDIKTQKEMKQPWVFAGSGFWTDDRSGEKFYMAEDGDFICVSNFASAMLDLPTESSQSAGGLLFEAYTDRIPDQGTEVTMVLTPKVEKKDEEKKEKTEKMPEKKAPATKPAAKKKPAA